MAHPTHQKIILIAEDDPSIGPVMARLLRRRGFETLIARDGKSALDILLTAERIDLLITDVDMPELSGAALASYCRRNLSIPVLFVSGGARAGREGLSPLLRKPFRAHELFAEISSLLDAPPKHEAVRHAR